MLQYLEQDGAPADRDHSSLHILLGSPTMQSSGPGPQYQSRVPSADRRWSWKVSQRYAHNISSIIIRLPDGWIYDPWPLPLSFYVMYDLSINGAHRFWAGVCRNISRHLVGGTLVGKVRSAEVKQMSDDMDSWDRMLNQGHYHGTWFTLGRAC
jgi:hypothetical protein